MVSVLVGPSEVEFTVHKDVVSGRSKYLEVACSQRWTEGRDNVVRLINTHPSTFQMYMDAMYNTLSYDIDASSRPLIKLYLLGDFLDDVKLRNKAMALLMTLKRCPSCPSIKLIWANTTVGSLLRDWAMDMVRSKLGAGHFANSVKEYPAEFVQQIAVSFYVLGKFQPDVKIYLEADGDGEDGPWLPR
jgi:hypothetical protein